MDQFRPCRRCAKKAGSNVPEGYYPDPENHGAVIECAHHHDWRLRKEHLCSYVRKGFREDCFELDYPTGYVGERSRHNVDRLVNFIQAFKTESLVRKSTLYLHGPRGCQKTLVASWIGAELTRAGFDCRFVLMNELARVLMSAERDEDAQYLKKKYEECDLLVFDESFDKDKVVLYHSGYQIPFIDTLIRGRIRTKCNVFISNIDIDEMDPAFGPSLKDLMKRETRYFDSDMEFIDNYRDLDGAIPVRLF